MVHKSGSDAQYLGCIDLVFPALAERQRLPGAESDRPRPEQDQVQCNGWSSLPSPVVNPFFGFYHEWSMHRNVYRPGLEQLGVNQLVQNYAEALNKARNRNCLQWVSLHACCALAHVGG